MKYSFIHPLTVILTCSATVEDGFRFDCTPQKNSASKVGGWQTNYVLIVISVPTIILTKAEVHTLCFPLIK